MTSSTHQALLLFVFASCCSTCTNAVDAIVYQSCQINAAQSVVGQTLRDKGSQSSNSKNPKKGTMIDQVLQEQNDNLSLWVIALELTGVWDDIIKWDQDDKCKSNGNMSSIILLAPTNATWKASTTAMVYLKNPDKWMLHLQSIVTLHVLVLNSDKLNTTTMPTEYSSSWTKTGSTFSTWNLTEFLTVVTDGPCFLSPGLGCVVSPNLLLSAAASSSPSSLTDKSKRQQQKNSDLCCIVRNQPSAFTGLDGQHSSGHCHVA